LLNFNNYVQGYSKNVLDIIENFSINPLVEKLHKNKRLYLLIDKFTEFDLHPDKIDNHQMDSVYEELFRKFSEMSNEESGDHFTPRDVVKLLVSFVFGGDKEDLQGEGKIRSVFDPCCGTGGMLTIGKEWVLENINSNLKIDLYGQELNDVTYSICKSDLLMMDENPESIQGPTSSISDDRHQGRKFDYMITNPPFCVSWKSEAEFVNEEAKDASKNSFTLPLTPHLLPNLLGVFCFRLNHPCVHPINSVGFLKFVNRLHSPSTILCIPCSSEPHSEHVSNNHKTLQICPLRHPFLNGQSDTHS
jgi:type I restriction-modification system DNA methylase subunit